MKHPPRATVECEGSPTVPGRGASSKGIADEACHDDGVLGCLRRGLQRGVLGGPSWPRRPRTWSRIRLWAWTWAWASLPSSPPPPVHRCVLRIRLASCLRRVPGVCRCPSAGGLRTGSGSGSRRRPGSRRDARPGLSRSAVSAEQLFGFRTRLRIQLYELSGSYCKPSPSPSRRACEPLHRPIVSPPLEPDATAFRRIDGPPRLGALCDFGQIVSGLPHPAGASRAPVPSRLA